MTALITTAKFFITSFQYAQNGYTILNMYSLKQQIQFNITIFGNKWRHRKEGPLCISL